MTNLNGGAVVTAVFGKLQATQLNRYDIARWRYEVLRVINIFRHVLWKVEMVNTSECRVR
jgi:hypothetical protein